MYYEREEWIDGWIKRLVGGTHSGEGQTSSDWVFARIFFSQGSPLVPTPTTRGTVWVRNWTVWTDMNWNGNFIITRKSHLSHVIVIRIFTRITITIRSSHPEVFLWKVVLKTLQLYWNHTLAWFFLYICCLFSENLFIRTPLEDCSWVNGKPCEKNEFCGDKSWYSYLLDRFCSIFSFYTP